MDDKNEKKFLDTIEDDPAFSAEGASCAFNFTGDEVITDDTNIDDADHIILAKEERSKSKWQHFLFRLRKVFSIRDDVANHEEIKERILSGGRFTGTNMVIMICAIIIASIGLNTNSVAVIIGAMLISPLMSRILIMSFGTATNDKVQLMNGLKGFLIQIAISIAVSTLYFLISPLKAPTEQILARCEPSLFDVLIAVAGGVAGIIGQTRKGQYNNVIPGVAIATALMPPLCVVGYSLANGQWIMMGLSFMLFFINFYFIYFSSVIVLNILEVPKVKELSVRKWRIVKFRMIRNTIIVLIPIIAVTVLFALHILPIKGLPTESGETAEAVSSALSAFAPIIR